MVGQKVHKTETLDVKTPAKGITRGWRPSPWKNRRVDLVEEDGGGTMLLVYREDDEVENSYCLDDVNDVDMIASKTHAHAFEITVNGSSLVILSGSTEQQSRDWILALRTLLRLQATGPLSEDGDRPMSGPKVHKTGTLDVKTPAKGFNRGWRPSPWKNRRVDIVEKDGQRTMLLVFDEIGTVEHSFCLDNVNDVTMIASKTHAHAFEITANGSSLVILSGSTELQSRDWIWALRRLFWPQAMVQLSEDDKMTVRLVPNEELYRYNIRGGLYELDFSVTGIRMKFLSKDSAADSRLTPVEPFIAEEPPSSFRLPLTTIGQYRLNDSHIEITTTPDSEFGVNTFVIETAGGSGASIPTILSAIKTAVFTATNCLHDAIAASYWNQDHVT